MTTETPDGPATQTRSFVEWADGLYYWRDNQWNESQDQIELVLGGGAAGTKAPYQAYFAPNANTVGAITLTLPPTAQSPDGAVLRTHVSALAYLDEASGNTVLLGVIQDSVGLLLPPNRVLYLSAFAGLRGDISYTFSKGTFIQDVTMLEHADPRDWGMNPATTVFQIWSEFLDVNEPEQINAVEVDGMTDHWFDLAGMRLGRGTAFSSDDGRRRGAPTAKSWVREDNRSFLVESIRYPAIQHELANLPPLQVNLRQPALDRAAFVAGLSRPPLEPRRGERIRMAKAERMDRAKGLTTDYIAYPAGNQTNIVFRADTTYLISGSANFFKTTTFEGGTCIKLVATNYAIVQTWSNVVFKSSAYRPVIFTSRNDRSVGEDIYLSGAVTNYFQALATSTTNVNVNNIRISYADTGLHTYGVNLRDAQFTHCNYALFPEQKPSEVNNVLIYDCTTAFGGGNGARITVRHVTVDRCNRLTHDWTTPTGWVVFTNCLFSQITSNGIVPTTNWYSATDNGANVFKTVGAGSHYLADGSPYRNAGTSEIPDWLGTNLTQCTTFGPMIWNNAITNDMTFEPAVERCGDYPSLGYHYPALDYLLTSINITNSELTIMPGTSIGIYGTNGFKIWNNGKTVERRLSTRTQPFRIVLCSAGGIVELAWRHAYLQ